MKNNLLFFMGLFFLISCSGPAEKFYDQEGKFKASFPISPEKEISNSSTKTYG
jgi:hypothetical protein